MLYLFCCKDTSKQFIIIIIIRKIEPINFLFFLISTSFSALCLEKF